MIAAWQVRPPRLVTMAAARFMIGSQSGSVMSAISTSPSLNSCICSTEVSTRAAPAPIFWPMARPSTSTSAPVVASFGILNRSSAPAARLHGLGTRLQHVEPAVDAVLAPLDVHRPAVVLLDDQRVPGQLLDLVVGQAEPAPLLGLDVHELRGPADGRVVGVDHLGRLVPHPALEDGGPAVAQGRLVDVELVGVHRTLDHALAEAVRRGDEDGVLEAGLGVHREHDAGRAEVGAHHPLHSRREADVAVGEAVVDAVGDGPVVVERGVDLTDRVQDRVDAADVEEGLLLAGERRVRQVLRRGRRAYGERHLLCRSPRPAGRRPRGCLRPGRRGTPARRRRPGSPCRPRLGGVRRRCRVRRADR